MANLPINEDNLPPNMPIRFQPLATYNAEVSRGIVHTLQWKAEMAQLQVDFNDWQRLCAFVAVENG